MSKNSSVALGLIACLVCSPVFSQSNGSAGFEPQIVNPVRVTKIGDARIPRLGDIPIPVYRGSEGNKDSRLAFHIPYLAYEEDSFNKLWDENNCASGHDESFHFSIEIETSSPDLIRQAENSLTNTDGSLRVGVLPYRLIEIIDPQNDKVIWRYPANGDQGVPYDTTFNGVVIGEMINCADLQRYISSPYELEAEVLIETSIESSNISTFTFGWFREHFLNIDFEQIANEDGGLSTEAWSRVQGSSSGGGLKGLVGGSRRMTLLTETNSTETDTRQRWVNINGLRQVAGQAGLRMRGSGFCVKSEDTSLECDQSDMMSRITELMERTIPREEVSIFASPPEDDFASTYIMMDGPSQVNRLREQSFDQSFSASGSLQLDCDAMRRAALAGATGGGSEVSTALQALQAQTGSAPGNNPWNTGENNASSSGSTSSSTTPKRPSSSKPSDCGLDDTEELRDRNGVKWSFSGEEWVPTSIEMYYVNEDSFSTFQSATIIETVATGEASLTRRGLQMIEKSSDPILGYDNLVERLSTLEAQSPRLHPVYRRFITIDSWGSNDVRFWLHPSSVSTQSLASYVRNGDKNRSVDNAVLHRGVELGRGNFRALKINLPAGRDRSDTLCTISGVAGKFDGFGESVFLHIHRNDYYLAGWNQAGGGAAAVLVECFAVVVR